MITASVLHAKPPNFLGTMPTEPTTYVRVAQKLVYGPADDTRILEDLFRQTNSIEQLWFAVAHTHRLVVARTVDGTALPQRSTSVGDVIRISDDSGERAYLCAMLGCTPIDLDLIVQSEPAQNALANQRRF